MINLRDFTLTMADVRDFILSLPSALQECYRALLTHHPAAISTVLGKVEQASHLLGETGSYALLGQSLLPML